jgi:hypothetical protein
VEPTHAATLDASLFFCLGLFVLLFVYKDVLFPSGANVLQREFGDLLCNAELERFFAEKQIHVIDPIEQSSTRELCEWIQLDNVRLYLANL